MQSSCLRIDLLKSRRGRNPIPRTDPYSFIQSRQAQILEDVERVDADPFSDLETSDAGNEDRTYARRLCDLVPESPKKGILQL
jgi:hypothetical protein